MTDKKVVEVTVDTAAVVANAEEKIIRPTAKIPYVRENMKFRYGLETYVLKKGEKNVELPLDVIQHLTNAGKL